MDVLPVDIRHDSFAAVVHPNAKLVRLYNHCTWAEGPVWWEAQKTLVWSDVVGRRVLGWREDGTVDALIDPSPFVNGNGIDHDGQLLHCEHGRRGISRTDAWGNYFLVGRYEGKSLNSPNDLIVASDGAIWFTDPTYGIIKPEEGYPQPQELSHTSVYRFDQATKTLKRMADFHQPNGLSFSPDERTLYVSQTRGDGHNNVIFAFDWDGKTLKHRRLFAAVETGVPDGLTVDKRGWLWVGMGSGIQVFHPNGKTIGIVPAPDLISNCTFDTQQNRVFGTGNKALYMLNLIP